MSDFIRKKKAFDWQPDLGTGAAGRLTKTIRLNVHSSLHAMLLDFGQDKGNRKCDGASGYCVAEKADRSITEIVQDAVKAYKGSIPLEGFRWDEQDLRLVMTSATMAALFETVVSPLVKKVTELVGPAKAGSGSTGVRVNEILMVGGFSQSPYLIGRIRQSFPALAPRLDPRSAVAVLNGALNYAKWSETENIIFDLSFGTAAARRFELLSAARQKQVEELNLVFRSPDPHDDFGVQYVRLFDPFFVKGQSYEVGHVITRRYIPLLSTETSLDVKLIACSDANAFHAFDDSCQQYGLINLPMPLPKGVTDPALLKLREVKLSIRYEHNLFNATVTDKTSGETRQLSVDFFNAPL